MGEGTPVRKRYRARHAWLVLAVLTLAGSSGCSIFQGVNDYLAYNDSMNDFVLGYRNSVWARQAWHERKGQFYGQPQFYDFGVGFRDGYASVASGGNGCPPPLPPRHYWSWKYQSPEGQAKVAAWFAGYPHGAAAAEEDGAGLYQGIQVSNAIERQYSPEFQYSMGMPNESPVQPNVHGEGVPAPAPVQGLIDPALPPLQPSSRVSPSAPPPPTTDSAYQRQPGPATGRVIASSYSESGTPAETLAIPSFVPIRMPTPKLD